jgi:NTP pyrophosphatase (non-canonical NTP hydrolase)
MTIAEFQQRIEDIYLEKDRTRGVEGTFAWFVEEVGELSRGLRRRDRRELEGEFADVLAWLATLASLAGVSLESAATAKYEAGCPKCRRTPCDCAEPRPSG